MNFWKLGSKWGSGAPNFYPYLKANSIVIGVDNRPYQVGDLVLITDGGFTGLAIAKVLGGRQPVLSQPEIEEDFDRLEIAYEDHLYTAPAIIYELTKSDSIWYETRVGICQINKWEITNKMLTLYTEFEKMQVITDTLNLLNAKGQIILQGPPGTGKTRLAKLVAEKLISEPDDMKLIQFHPAYTYEDFVRGVVADTNAAGQLEYRAENKALGAFATRAFANPDRKFVLIIDEINRANLPSVLGELIYALEYRGEAVESIYGIGEAKNHNLLLPKNLLIIGTMNTADRSAGHLDYAIRRRFAFVSVEPNASVVPEGAARKLFEDVKALFSKPYLSSEFQPAQVQPGHSYFLTSESEGLSLRQKLDYEIRPLLYEYLNDGILLPAAREKVEALSV